MIAGRPTKKTEQIVTEMMTRLMMGESLIAICRDEHMPNRATVFKWLRQDHEFCDKYTRARELQQEHYLDRMIEIANDSSGDLIVGTDGVTRPNPAAVQRHRLQIDAMKWAMERLAPKRYGKQLVTTTETPAKPVIIQMTDKQIERINRKLDGEY